MEEKLINIISTKTIRLLVAVMKNLKSLLSIKINKLIKQSNLNKSKLK